MQSQPELGLMMTSLYPQAWKLRMDRRLNIPTGNPALNKYTRCRYMVSWLPVLTPICQDGSVPAHMLVKLSLGHRCQAMIVLNGQLAQHCKSLLFWRGKFCDSSTEEPQSGVKHSDQSQHMSRRDLDNRRERTKSAERVCEHRWADA